MATRLALGLEPLRATRCPLGRCIPRRCATAARSGRGRSGPLLDGRSCRGGCSLATSIRFRAAWRGAPAPRARSPTSPTASSAAAPGCASAPCAASAATSPCRAGTGRRCAPASSASSPPSGPSSSGTAPLRSRTRPSAAPPSWCRPASPPWTRRPPGRGSTATPWSWACPVRRGHSREKRHDCPPLTLGLVLDASSPRAARCRPCRRPWARLETALRTLHEGPSRQGTTRRVEKVWQRIGRLQARHPSAAPHCAIDVQADDRGRNATAVAWKRQLLEGSGATHPGVHGLRTSSVGCGAPA